MARLFTGPRGGRISTAVLRDATHWDEVVIKLGHEHLRRHDLRHTGLTWMADAGVPLHVLRKIAGHGSLTTTQRHLHPDKRSIEMAGARPQRASGERPYGGVWSQSGPGRDASTASADRPLGSNSATQKPADLEKYSNSASFQHRRDDRI